MDIKIGVAHHREFYQYRDDVFFPIQVGRAICDTALGMIGDDEGDSISVKNKYYCELTATYWLWKNCRSADYIGLCHYRRYFSKKEHGLYFFVKKIKHFILRDRFESGAFFAESKSVSSKVGIDTRLKGFSVYLKKDIDKGKFDIYALRPVKMLNENLHTHFSKPAGSFPIELLLEIVKESKPEYHESLVDILGGRSLHYANMVIMSRFRFDLYCEFLFDVLSEHEARIVSSGWCLNPSLEGCYSRLPGYLGELLTSCFITHQAKNGVNVEFLPSYFLTDEV